MRRGKEGGLKITEAMGTMRDEPWGCTTPYITSRLGT